MTFPATRVASIGVDKDKTWIRLRQKEKGTMKDIGDWAKMHPKPKTFQYTSPSRVVYGIV